MRARSAVGYAVISFGMRGPAIDQQRELPGGSFREPEQSVDQGSRLPTFNWRHPIPITDAGGGKVFDSRAALAVFYLTFR